MLVGANLVPLVGAVFFGWSVWTILVLYWIENGIVGVLNVPKILLAQGRLTVDLAGSPLALGSFGALRFLFAPFFLLQYGIFWAVHGFFVLGFLPLLLEGSPALGTLSAVDVAIGGAGLAIGHGSSFVVNFVGRREYRSVSAWDQVQRPYRRVAVLQLTIILGAWGIVLLGSPVVLLGILVLAKMTLDVRSHLADHGRVRRLVRD